MKEKKRRNSLMAITLRIAAAVLAIWLLCMAVITIVTAQLRYDKFSDYCGRYEWSLTEWARLDMVADSIDEVTRPGYLENKMVDSVCYTGDVYASYADDAPLWLRHLDYSRDYAQSAVAFYTPEWELILHSGSYLYFDYGFEHSWQEYYDGEAYIDLNKLGNEAVSALRAARIDKIGIKSPLRVSGFLDGAELIPSKIEIDVNENRAAIRGREWETIYETNGNPDDTVFYVDYYTWRDYESDWAIEHETLGEYANICEFMLDNVEHAPISEYGNLSRILVLRSRTFFNDDEWDETNSDTPPIAFHMVTATVAKPLQSAINELLYVYLFTFVASVLLVLLVRRSIKKNFTDPVKWVHKGVSEGWGYVTTALESKTMWREPYEISRHYRKTLDKLREDKNEIARLNTALEYAKEAEEQRRQLSSNIAHELKTPLAVIRSYAEGLQEHIAEEKRDKYLEVIVSETGRMDDMVLEMLDLSRLEAGKVKLARDVFDLSKLARGVFEKLEAAAAAKELTISYELLENCLVNVDEARISQVIENFASNALRYTPHGGHIWVRTSFALGRTTLAVENTSPPLSEEVLSRVWERFYRADESRSEKSSGLGLAIAKSIVELHAGHCCAKSTENGVEFSFTI